jgi:hypothetical protein
MFFAWDGLGAVLFSAGQYFASLTALVESTDEPVIVVNRLGALCGCLSEILVTASCMDACGTNATLMLRP